jgi:hypothetical protein
MLAAANLLSQATSPYLRQHAANPVHWRVWGAPALEEARERDRPILISIGYAACHWCHVMAHESFENEETAALMNQLFVNVKVDREERPDIDHIYMSALHSMGQQGGWPLTMFLTPDGKPMFGGTYWPPSPRWGRPSFTQVLRAVDRAWSEQRGALTAQGDELFDHLAAMAATRPGPDLSPADLTGAAALLMRQLDPVHGGVGGAPKFPNAPMFRFLWSEYFRRGDAAARDAVRRLLDALCLGGIYDHLGGGFARYSTDAEWHVPHFEKMLYDNAQILELLAFAQTESPTPLYGACARATMGWLTREMLVDGGGFAASQDADQDGEEGLFFVWSEAEIDAALGPAAAPFKRAYDVRPEGNWEGRNVLRRLEAPQGEEEEAAFAASRARLFLLREGRPKPARDDKTLADWNGLMISALARAAVAFDEPGWLETAAAAYAFVDRNLRDQSGRLVHAWRDGRIGAAGLLDDYASFARAALALFEATGVRAYLERAVELALEAQNLFGDSDGSFFVTAREAADVPGARPRYAHDGATPSGVGLMAEVLARLFHLTGQPRWRSAAESLIRAFTGAADGRAGSPQLLAAADFLERGTVIVVAGASDDPAARKLLHAALSWPDPATCVLRAVDPGDWPESSPAHGKQTVDSAAAAYLCRGQTCSLPVVTPAALSSLMRLAPPRILVEGD